MTIGSFTHIGDANIGTVRNLHVRVIDRKDVGGRYETVVYVSAHDDTAAPQVAPVAVFNRLFRPVA